MSMAAAIDRRTADAPAWPRASRIASIEVISDLAQAEPIWRMLEADFQASTPYQRFDFLSIWQQQVGERQNVQPFIVIAYDGDRQPLLLLPLARTRHYGVCIASFMGGKHANLKMGVWGKDFAAEANAADLDALLAGIRKLCQADVLLLTQQPQRWRGLTNPFVLLPHQPSVNGCPVLKMEPGSPPQEFVSNALRRRLKHKERKLQTLPGYRYHVASSEAEIARLMDWFFLTKPQRMAEQRLPNVFAEPGVEDFVRKACVTQLASGRRAIEIHALECEQEVIALFAGVADGFRFSMMFNTYTMSHHSRYSPGLILIRNIADYYAALGYRVLDLGIGTDDYKRQFCKSDEPIFDSFIPLSLRGRFAASAMSAVCRGKRLVKHNRMLLWLAQRLRGIFY